MSKVLIVDVETTGLPPRNIPPWKTDMWSKCRMVQIAWEVWCNDVLESASVFVIKPDGYTIPDESARIHGITTTMARKHGVSIDVVWDELSHALCNVDTIVAHNISFDDAVIQSELSRYKQYKLCTKWNNISKYCTMKMATMPGKKWPKLIELYKECFGREPDGTMHTADADVRACAEIYFHMKKEAAQQ